MVLATVNTGHFQFTALGADKEECDVLLLAAWRKHCRQVPHADALLMREIVADGEVNYSSIERGSVLRDGERF